jgi:hypothetical protein
MNPITEANIFFIFPSRRDFDGTMAGGVAKKNLSGRTPQNRFSMFGNSQASSALA